MLCLSIPDADIYTSAASSSSTSWMWTSSSRSSSSDRPCMTEPHLVCPAPGLAAAAGETPAVWCRRSCEWTSRRSCCFPPALPPPRPGLRRPCNKEHSRSQMGAARRGETQKYARLICRIKHAHTGWAAGWHTPQSGPLFFPHPGVKLKEMGQIFKTYFI